MRQAVLLVLSLFLCSAAFGQNDLMIKKTTDMKMPGLDMGDLMSKSSSSAVRRSRTTTIMVKGSRLRSESVAPKFSILHAGSATREISYIQQCDLGRTVHLDRSKKTYTLTSATGVTENAKTQAKIANAKKGGYMDVSINVTDLNERKEMFGFVAKHLRSTMTMTPGPNSCSKQPMSIVDEGWYVDLPTFACEIQTDDTISSMQETDSGCADEVRYKAGTNIHLGFPLQLTRTFSMNGVSFQMIENVISLDRATLDASAFEIPADYRPSDGSDANAAVTDPQPAPQTTSAPKPDPAQYPADWQTKALPQMAQISDASSTPKVAGTIRIGIVTPTTDMGQGFEGFDAGQVVQSAFLDKLKADRIEAVPITAGVLVAEQAKAKQCDYLMYVDIKRKKGGGGGFLTKMIITNIGCMAGNAACAAASAGTGIPGRIKNRDEITLEYHVNKLDGSTAVPAVTLKKKAEKDGDDVLSPMIGEASGNVISTVGKTN